jgi:hypothetical protein
MIIFPVLALWVFAAVSILKEREVEPAPDDQQPGGGEDDPEAAAE